MARADSRITINAVCPGFVDTPMLADAHDTLLHHGLGIADPDEIAETVQTIVDDGRTGGAWIVQANQPPTPVEYATIELGQTG